MNDTATKPTFEVSKGPKAIVARAANFQPRESIYPWAALEAPEQGSDGVMYYSQFFVPGKTTKKFSGLAQAAGKRLSASTGIPTTFAVRQAQENDVAGVLVQRVEYREPRKVKPKAA